MGVQNLAGDVISLNLPALLARNATVADLKRLIYNENRVQSHRQILARTSNDNQEELIDHRTIASYNLTDDDTIHLFVQDRNPGELTMTISQLQFPTKICIENSEVYVLDEQGIKVFTANGDLIRQFGDRDIRAIFIKHGELYVCFDGQIVVYNLDGHPVRQFEIDCTNLSGISDIFVENDEVYVVERNRDNIKVFGTNGGFKRMFGKKGNRPGRIQNVSGIWVTPYGEVYVMDINNTRVQVFDTNGKFIRIFTEGLHPTGIFIKDGEVYIADNFRPRPCVKVFSSENTYIRRYGNERAGSGHGQFERICGIFVTDDEVYAIDTNNNRVQVFDR